MDDIRLSDPARFAGMFLSTYLAQGFQSLSKRDIDLLVFLLLEQDGWVDRTANNFGVGRQLRLTPNRVRTLRRDAYARWRPLIGDDRAKQLEAILKSVLTEDAIAAGARHASEKSRKEGFLAVRVEHADDREEFEQAILDAGAIPIYERNRDVIVVRFDTLLTLSATFNFIQQDAKRIRDALKRVAPAVEEVQNLLRKNVKEVTWEDVRSAFNSAGAAALSGSVKTKVSALLRIALPFLG